MKQDKKDKTVDVLKDIVVIVVWSILWGGSAFLGFIFWDWLFSTIGIFG